MDSNQKDDPFDPLVDNSVDIIDRLRQVLQVGTDTALSEFLGTTPQAVARAKSKKVPIDWLFQAHVAKGVSIDWLLTGRGEKKIFDLKDNDLKVLVDNWAVLPSSKRREIMGIINNERFPHLDEAQKLPAHSAERAFFIQQRAFKEYGYVGLNFETTVGKDDYLAGKIDDAEFYRLCREETERLRNLILMHEQEK